MMAFSVLGAAGMIMSYLPMDLEIFNDANDAINGGHNG